MHEFRPKSECCGVHSQDVVGGRQLIQPMFNGLRFDRVLLPCEFYA